MERTGKPPKNGYRYRILSYQRVSREEAASGSFTFETQTLRIRETLERRYGAGAFDLEELRDDGISGGYGPEPTGVERRTRPTLKTIAAKLRTGGYDCLVIYNSSRLFRSPRWFYQFLEDVILPSDVEFLSATENLDVISAEGRAMAGMLAVVNGLFRDTVIKRNQDAAATRREQGYYVGQTGYGWEWEPLADVPARGRRRIRPIAEHGRWIVQIKDRYLAGWGYTRIVAELNSLGVPSPSGKRWVIQSIKQVLETPTHAGLVPSANGPLRGEHFEYRYYDPEVFEQIQALRIQKRERFKTNTGKSGTHLLNGFIYCGRCGSRLYVSSPGSIYRGYRCVRGLSQGKRTCPVVTVRAEPVERVVVEEIRRVAETPELRELLLEEAAVAAAREDTTLTDQREQLRETLDSLKKREARLFEAFERELIGEAQFSTRNRDLLAERAEAERELHRVETALTNRQAREAWVERVRGAVLDFPRVWEHLNMDERRQLLSLLLEKLTADRQGRDNRLTLKLYLLPERTIPVMIGTTARMKVQPTGLQSLTPRHLVLLHYLGEGKTIKEAAALMGVQGSTVQAFLRDVYQRLGVRNTPDAIAMAKPRINALFTTLPFGQPWERRSEAVEAPSFSPKLLEVFRLLASGAKTREVARITGLSYTTVAGRRVRILTAFRTDSIFTAAQQAREMGIL